MPLYVGVDGVSRDVKAAHVGVDGVARKVVAIYAGVDGVTRKVWSSNGYSIAYTGAYTDTIITSGAKSYKLLTLTGSGQLTVEGEVKADICLVGGGANGRQGFIGSRTYGGPGGAGGYLEDFYNIPLETSNVQIGQAQENTTFGTLKANGATAQYGGTGGGGSYPNDVAGTIPGKGDGRSKYPFGDTVSFQPHCAGGGGGSSASADAYWGLGAGGTNGGDGQVAQFYTNTGGSGGVIGGGKGGNNSSTATSDGADASFYGSGGGGAGAQAAMLPYWDTHLGTPGKGYQGVAYIRIDLGLYPAT